MRRLLAAALFAVAGSAYAHADQIDRMVVDTMETITPDTLDWKDEPILPKGAKSALIVGDPNKAGVFIAYLKFPPNYQIAPHTHPFTEVITVVQGKLGNGMGERFDSQSGEMLDVGSSFTLPADHAHYVWTADEETVIVLTATGPWDITYTDPKDDPRSQ